MIESHGFQAKTYDVVTPQGYILPVTRVINPLADQSSITRTAVFHHGISQNAMNPALTLCSYTQPQKPVNTSQLFRHFDNRFNLNGQLPYIDESLINRNLYDGVSSLLNITNVIDKGNPYTLTCLPLHLSNNNYDVWLFEARGSSPAATRHTNPFISVEEYYNFDLHDQATKDLPALIAKVKEISGRDKVAYFGFSQSTAFMFILLSEEPEFQENLTAFVAVSPVTFCSETKGLLREIFDVLTSAPGIITNNLNVPFPFVYEDAEIFDSILTNLCEEEEIAATVCREIVNYLAGPDDNLNVLVSMNLLQI